jgi:H+-transporting ATPase
MRVVLGIATLLGMVGVVSSFLIFYIGMDVFHLPHDHDQGMLQSFIFLKLAIAGHLTIFLSRTRGHFWSIMPNGKLFWSAVVTKVLATLVVVYGLFITPLRWDLALFVWGYALVAFVITDYIKIGLYRLFDHSDLKFHR